MEKKLSQLWSKILKMNVFKLYSYALMIQFINCFVIVAFLQLIGAEFSQNVASSSEMSCSLFALPFVCLCAFVEEILFRWGPMVLCFYLVKKFGLQKYQREIIFLTIISSSIVFGCVHGNAWNILIQGISGVIIYAFYMRALVLCGETEKFNWQIKPLVASTLFHTTWNMLLIMPVLIIVVVISAAIYLYKDVKAVKALKLSNVTLQ